MKSLKSCSLIILIALSFTTHAQSWVDVGMPKFTAGEADDVSIAMGKNDTPYVVYVDFVNNFSPTVMKFNGTSWVAVGSPGFSGNEVQYTSIAMDSSGAPYVIYQDENDSAKATVMKFNGSSWEPLGAPGLSIGQADFTCMAIGSSDTPFVLFNDLADSCIPKFSVMKFNGSNWEYIGPSRFTPILTNPGSIAVWGNTPYIAYSDTGLGKAIVLMWDGSNWVTVGAPDFSSGQVASISLVIHGGTPYVAYSDFANSMKATVMKYNGTNWETVGSAGFSAAEADNTTLAVDNTGTPYVVYADDATTSSYVTVMKFNGTGWVNVGSPGFSGTLDVSNSIAINSGGVPYVFYEGFAGGEKGTVEKFVANTSVKNIADPSVALHVFPDPDRGVFTVNISSLQNETATITITNMLGEEVQVIKGLTNTGNQVQIADVPGIYFVSAVLESGKRSQSAKVVVE